MNNNLLNGLWLIIVSLIANNAISQITILDNNNVELTVNCEQFDQISPPMSTSTCEGDLDYTFEDKLYSGGCMGTIERVWTIRDACNNITNYQQFIRFEDNTVPELSEYPSDVSVTLSDVPTIPEITANDNCAQKLNVKFTEEILKDEQDNTSSIIRKWYVKDKCGNIKKHQQTITIKTDNS